jgi:hypothetical protein
VHVIAGYMGVLYNRSFFSERLRSDLLSSDTEAWFVDDDYISGQADRMGVVKLVVPHAPDATSHNIFGCASADDSLTWGLNVKENVERQSRTLSKFFSEGRFAQFHS